LAWQGARSFDHSSTGVNRSADRCVDSGSPYSSRWLVVLAAKNRRLYCYEYTAAQRAANCTASTNVARARRLSASQIINGGASPTPTSPGTRDPSLRASCTLSARSCGSARPGTHARMHARMHARGRVRAVGDPRRINSRLRNFIPIHVRHRRFVRYGPANRFTWVPGLSARELFRYSRGHSPDICPSCGATRITDAQSF